MEIVEVATSPWSLSRWRPAGSTWSLLVPYKTLAFGILINLCNKAFFLEFIMPLIMAVISGVIMVFIMVVILES